MTPELHSAGCRDRLASAESPDTTASVAGRRMGTLQTPGTRVREAEEQGYMQPANSTSHACLRALNMLYMRL